MFLKKKKIVCQVNQQRGFQGLSSIRTLWGGKLGYQPLILLPLKLGLKCAQMASLTDQSYKQ